MTRGELIEAIVVKLVEAPRVNLVGVRSAETTAGTYFKSPQYLKRYSSAIDYGRVHGKKAGNQAMKQLVTARIPKHIQAANAKVSEFKKLKRELRMITQMGKYQRRAGHEV